VASPPERDEVAENPFPGKFAFIVHAKGLLAKVEVAKGNQ
jgi:hypothetical protein